MDKIFVDCRSAVGQICKAKIFMGTPRSTKSFTLKNFRLYSIWIQKCECVMIHHLGVSIYCHFCITIQRYIIRYCLLRGRVKEKSSTVFTIKCLVCCFRYQVCCIGNTALWLANTIQLFQLSSATAAVNNPP